MNIGLRQSGFTIIEGLIAFLIMTASGLALVLFLPKMLGESSNSSNYTLASNFAQDKLESLRQFASETACTTMTSGSDTGSSASASFDRTWTVAECPNSLKCKIVKVSVGWTDTSGQSKNVNLSTNTECYDPVQSGIALVAISTGSESTGGGGGGSTSGNNSPVAIDDSVTVSENTNVTINVLSNDSDPDGDNLTVNLESNPTNGTVTKSGQTYIYTPLADFVGNDSFSYFALDGNGGSDVAIVYIEVQPSSGETYLSCPLPWEGSIAHGLSVTAYQEDVTESCNNEIRTCNNGVLSGTYEFESCNEYIGIYNIVITNNTGDDKLDISSGWTVTYIPQNAAEIECSVVDANYNNIADEASITLTEGCSVYSGSLSTEDTMTISGSTGNTNYSYTVDILEINTGATRAIKGEIR
jgi:Tfp pilus assembly protein PilV